MESIFDKTLEGKRVRLLRKPDQFTDLKPGDMGTIKYMFLNLDSQVIEVEWDKGNRLGLIVGVDEYEIID